MAEFLKESVAGIIALLISMAVCGVFHLLTGAPFVYLLAGVGLYHVGRLEYLLNKEPTIAHA